MKLTIRSAIARQLLGAGVMAAGLATALPAHAQDRYAAFVVDPRTDEILHADMADERRFPASLTKMMTLYLLFDALESGQVRKDTQLPVSRFAAAQPPSKLGLRRGSSISVDAAIRALVTKSANDVAVVVAEKLGGSEARFAALMTAKARQIGMNDTRFMNASGLPNMAQVTTARDMAVLGEALMRDHPQHYGYFKLASMTWGNRSHRNHNRLLGAIEGVDGIKTGYTNASGFNLVSAVERQGVRLIAVVMGGETGAARDAQMAYLIEGAYEELARRRGAPSGAMLVSLPMAQTRVSFPDGSEAESEDVAAPSDGGGDAASERFSAPAAPADASLPILPARPTAFVPPSAPVDDPTGIILPF